MLVQSEFIKLILKRRLSAVCLVLLGLQSLPGQVTWNGSTSSQWGNSANWNGPYPDGVGATAGFYAASPPNQPTLGANRTLTQLFFNGRADTTISGESIYTLTFDPGAQSLVNSISVVGGGGFLYLKALYFECHVTFGGTNGTHRIWGDRRVYFGNSSPVTVRVDRELIINQPSQVVQFGNWGSNVTLHGSAPIQIDNAYNVVFFPVSPASSYSGTVTLRSGWMTLYGNLSPLSTVRLGDTNGAAGVMLTLAPITPLSTPIVVAAGSSGEHVIYLAGGTTITLDSPLCLGSEGAGKNLTFNQAQPLSHLNGPISDPAGLAGAPGNITAFSFANTNVLRIGGSATNTFSGGVIVSNATVELGKVPGTAALSGSSVYVETNAVLQHQSALYGHQIHDAATVQVEGVYHVNGAIETIGGLTGSGVVRLGSGQLSVGGGSDSVFGGTVQGAGQLRKVGENTRFVLTQSNSYTAGTVIDAGELMVANTSGSATGPGTVWVNDGGILSGSGIIAPAADAGVLVGDGGVLRPGSNSISPLVIALSGVGTLQLLPGSTLEFQLGSAGQDDLQVNSVSVGGDLMLIAHGAVSAATYCVLSNVTAGSGTFASVHAPAGFAAQAHGWTGDDYLVTLRTATAYELWRQQHWGLAYSVNMAAGDLADPDGDGVSNLAEYAFNLNPLAGDRQVLTPDTGANGIPNIRMGVGAEAGRLIVEFVRRKAGTNPEIAYAVLFADTLQSAWATNANATTSVTSIDATWERVRVVDSAALPLQSQRYARVRVAH